MKNYDETHKYGRTTVHIVYPAAMTDEELQRRIKVMCLAAWDILDNDHDEEEPNGTTETPAATKSIVRRSPK